MIIIIPVKLTKNKKKVHYLVKQQYSVSMLEPYLIKFQTTENVRLVVWFHCFLVDVDT